MLNGAPEGIKAKKPALQNRLILAARANMASIGCTNPAVLNGIGQLAFKPGASITDTASGALVFASGTAKFNRPEGLRIANVAKNKFSYAHCVFNQKRRRVTIKSMSNGIAQVLFKVSLN
jgi:hypothetical protein